MSILRSGISLGKRRRFVYFMPISADYGVSYQWGRELRRWGVKNFAAAHFRLPDNELVWVGKYNEEHVQLPLAEAIGQFLKAEEPMGYEFYVERKVTNKEIVRVRPLPHPIGWRYFPNAKGRKPCFCPACIAPGEYGSSKQRKEWEAENEGPRLSIPEAKRIIASSDDPDELWTAVQVFGPKTRRADPSFLFRLLDFDDEFLRHDTLKAIGTHAHPNTRTFLESYESDDEETKELITELLAKRGWR